jgi:hypothetical protein
MPQNCNPVLLLSIYRELKFLVLLAVSTKVENTARFR